MKNTMGKSITASFAVIMAAVLVGTHAFTSTSMDACASMKETTDCVKVFVGDTDHAPEGYAQQRVAYINNIADTKSNATMEAVICFDDYYTVEQITAWAEGYDITINRAYMWPRGETGRLGLYVENNDIESSMDVYKEEVEEAGFCDDPTFAADYQRFLDGEYDVFALTVTATAETLEALNAEADYVSYVDVMYNAEVETYAARAGKAVSYVELPSKPDGAL